MEMWSKRQLSKKWVEYNDFFNEGGDGYNPHKKYEEVQQKSIKIGKKEYTVEQAREMLKELEESLPKHTDVKKIEGCKDCIQMFKSVLMHCVYTGK